MIKETRSSLFDYAEAISKAIDFYSMAKKSQMRMEDRLFCLEIGKEPIVELLLTTTISSEKGVAEPTGDNLSKINYVKLKLHA